MPHLFRLICFAVFGLFVSASVQAQQHTYTGTLIDAQTKEPVPYATVLLKKTGDDVLIAGTTTSEQGFFKVRTAETNLYIELSFIGYQTQKITDFNPQQKDINLGTLELSQNAQALNEVEVVQERSKVEFKLDKRVFNVGTDISSTGMGALEVLQNVPSVNVDIEGQVTLRGNSGVQILINGKPSVLSDEGSNALGSITADMIESVEVITNPSAKYEAGGTSGILNIILKKDEKKGLNGSVSVNTGMPDNHSVGVSLNKRTEKFNLFTQFGGGYRSIPRFRESINLNKITGEKIVSDGTEFRNEEFYNITLGTDYYINDRNVITLSGNFALELEDQPSETDFQRLVGDETLTSAWRREEVTTATNPKYQYDLQYERVFADNEDHKLQFSTLGSFFGKDLESDFTNTTVAGDNVDARQRTETDFYQANYTYKLDYTNPISETFTLEAGSQYDINDVGNDFAVSNLKQGTFVIDSGLTNNFEWNQRVLGVYTTAAYEGDRWGVKLGARVEHTNLKTLLTTTQESNEQNYTNLFPTLHSSYKFSEFISLQAGYSRRIFRPRLWDLNPFFNIRNNFNIWQGNPDLQPEYADSYELTGIFIFKKASINTSLYHLYTTDVVERVSFFEDNVNITKPVNVGTRNKTGLEVNGKYTPTRELTINGDFNYGVFFRRGTFNGQNFDFEGDQWSTRITSKFKLPSNFDIELTGRYQSRFKTVQGEVSGFAHMDIGVRKKLWDGKAVVNVSVRDVFASRIRENVIDQESFYLYSFSQRGRFITLGFSYSFGKGEAMTYSGRRR